jgi:uncharacterized repeat protein (TIGR01451 family)
MNADMRTLRRRSLALANQARVRRGGLRFFHIFVGVMLTIQSLSLGVLFAPVTMAAVTVTPGPNPSIQQTCGLDIGLIIDTSGSVDSSEMDDMKSALTSFVNAFSGTPTWFSLTRFGTDSTLLRAFTDNPSLITGDINDPTKIFFSPVAETNWDAGLGRSNDSFDPRAGNSNLIVIATDGSPNRFGYPTTDPSGQNYATAVDPAVTRANILKAAGTRVVVIGIGEDNLDPDSPADKLNKMIAISGPTVATTPGDITVGTDVIKVSSFSGIGNAMASYAQQLCPGSVRVSKQVDSDLDNQYEGGNTEANQLGFTWAMDNGGANAMGTTVSAVPGQHAINEAATAASTFVGWYDTNPQLDRQTPSCSNPQTLDGTTLPISITVNPQQNTEIVLCNKIVPGNLVVNIQYDDNGDGNLDRVNPSGSTWTIDSNESTHAAGSGLTVNPGTYTVSQNLTVPSTISISAVASGYTASWVCSNPTSGTGGTLSATVPSGQTVTCTFTNTRQVTTISIDKTGPATANPGNQLTYTLAWSVAGNTSATNAVLTDTIPANTSFVSANNGGSFASGVVAWNLGTKAPGSSGTVTVTVSVNTNLTSATTLTNTGTFDTDQTTPVSDTVITNVTIPQVLGATTEPKLTLTKAVNVSRTNPGKTVNYTLVVTNTGDADAKNVIVTDTLPDGFTYADTGRTTKSWTYSKLTPGESKKITYDVKIGTNVTAGEYVNHAIALADGIKPVPADATVTVNVPKVLGLVTTGVGARDYLIFMLGLSLMGAGFILLQRYRRQLGLTS